MISASGERLPNIWMNVTTSVNWARAVVGIVRVERELCRELALLYGNRFGQCVFQGGEFVPYKGGTDAAGRPSGIVWPDLSRSFPRSATFDQPFSFHKPVPPPPPTIPGGAAARALVKAKGSEANAPDEIQYGDILLSVGLDWEHSYLDIFDTLRQSMGIQIVTCCYDLIPVLFPQYCVGHVAAQFKQYFAKLSWSSQLMLCISKQSQSDYKELVNRIGAPEIGTVVMPLGDNVPGLDGEISAPIRKLAEKPFILFVSTIERRKNHEVLYRAYHLLAKAGHGDILPKLVFVGMPGWGVGDLLKDIELDPLTDDMIVQLNHVDDAELGYLYNNAAFMVYPSLYEGWGLPVGEALACGKAILASGQGSIPEVGGDLVTYVDPWCPQDWADIILQWVQNPDQVRAIENKVVQNYVPRTWADTAKAVKGALDAMLNISQDAREIFPGYDMRTIVGTACGEAVRSRGDSGVLLHGPYWMLPPGTFEIEILLDKIGTVSASATFSIVSGTGTVVHGSKRFNFEASEQFGERYLITADVAKAAKDFEVVCTVDEGLLISVNKITVRPIAAIRTP